VDLVQLDLLSHEAAEWRARRKASTASFVDLFREEYRAFIEERGGLDTFL
jgi:hypothetical protein